MQVLPDAGKCATNMRAVWLGQAAGAGSARETCRFAMLNGLYRAARKAVLEAAVHGVRMVLIINELGDGHGAGNV